jgi:hypothetical protein
MYERQTARVLNHESRTFPVAACILVSVKPIFAIPNGFQSETTFGFGGFGRGFGVGIAPFAVIVACIL